MPGLIYINKKTTLSLLFLGCMALNTYAQNPYLPLGEFIPDGEPYVLDDPDNPKEAGGLAPSPSLPYRMGRTFRQKSTFHP